MTIYLREQPTAQDWIRVRQRALATAGKSPFTVTEEPSDMWKHSILEARHSPIRYLRFSFYLENIPYWVSVHLCRHVHSQPYVCSQRNDRQDKYDRNEAPQNQPVNMIWDMNAEELMTIANKRLCNKASPETRKVVECMCGIVENHCPEFRGLLVPNCVYHGGVCHEMHTCGQVPGQMHMEDLMK